MAFGSEYEATKADMTAGAGPVQGGPPLSLSLSGAWGLARDRDNEILMGMASESVAGVQERGAALALSQNEQQQRQSEKNRQRTADMMLLALLEQIDALNREIAEIRRSFEDKFGDAWREELALRVFDIVPEKLANESLEDYRTRLEAELIDKMIDPTTGEIKDEYQNHPDEDVRTLATLAKSEYDLNQKTEEARDLLKLAPEQIQKALEQGKDITTLREAYKMTDNAANKSEINRSGNSNIDLTMSSNPNMSGF